MDEHGDGRGRSNRRDKMSGLSASAMQTGEVALDRPATVIVVVVIAAAARERAAEDEEAAEGAE